MSDESKTWRETNSHYRVVKLSRPIPVDGAEVSELRIREPRADDLEDLPGLAFTKPMTLLAMVLARCAGLSHPEVRQLTIPDLLKCQEALCALGFLPTDAYALMGSAAPSRETGPTGSE